jgi:hypothetical protein
MRTVFRLVLVALLSLPAWGKADLSISLPLGPYYRPGKYIPVRMTATVLEPSDAWAVVAADNVGSKPTDQSVGAMRTSINLRQGPVDAIVPWLVLNGRAKRPRLFIEDGSEFVEGPDL